MKKHLRVLAAVLVLCFSLLCPAASAASVQTAACKPSTAAVQTISAGKKTEQMVWVPTHGGFICVHKKLTKEITEKLQNPIAKWFQKSYNMVTARAQALLSVKSFSSCFFGISGTGSPPPAVLLHSRDPCAAQAVSRFVCKKARPFWTSFFASINHAKTGFSCGKV